MPSDFLPRHTGWVLYKFVHCICQYYTCTSLHVYTISLREINESASMIKAKNLALFHLPINRIQENIWKSQAPPQTELQLGYDY